MTGLNKLTLHPIYIFDIKDSHTNPLRDFMNFVRIYKKKRLIDFSYSGDIDSLHKNIALKDNFTLDALPKTLIKQGEDNFKLFLKTLKNPHLKELIFMLGNLDQKVSELSEEQIKLTSLIKSLLSQSEYIFLLNPEQFSHKNTLTILKKAIKFEAFDRGRKVLIRSDNSNYWLDICGNIISKNQNNYSCTKNEILTSTSTTRNISKAA